ncbi:hypothetical protein TNCV_5022671 [Trichonephila clavipes]|nr:hypothetical protein TNCV_5022671 [Trichonephila clavipes]
MLPEPARQVGLLYDRWRHHRFPPTQLDMELEGREIFFLHPSALVASAVTTHKTFGPTDLTSMYSVCTRRAFSGIGHRTQAFLSDPML